MAKRASKVRSSKKRTAKKRTTNPRGEPACSPRVGRMGAAERKSLPASAFGLPSERKYPLRRRWGKATLPDVEHASAAKAYAKREYDRGKLTTRQYQQVVRRANEAIAECRRKRNPAEYERTHEGDPGDVNYLSVAVPDPSRGRVVLLGELTEVTYRTVKGSDRGQPTEYVHRFKPRRPLLLYSREGLFISKADFKVTERGIVG